jgi:hypothetical protein
MAGCRVPAEKIESVETARANAAIKPRAVLPALLIATVAGATHGLFSLYWAAGGNYLVSTLGHQLVSTFADRRWLLIPVSVIKIGFAVLPLVLARLGWPGRQFWRTACWVGAAVLVVWGGVNTLVGNLVLAGILRPGEGYDRAGMVGHAWLWDPLFFIWGAALVVALFLTRHRDQSYAAT